MNITIERKYIRDMDKCKYIRISVPRITEKKNKIMII